MFSLVSDNIDDLYVRCLKIILEHGEMTNPRGFNCKELSPCSIVLTNPQNNILANTVRKASKAFMGAELLWILMGRNDVDMISFYNSKISQFSDDGKTFFGAYGPKVSGQLEYVLKLLEKDPWSRQGVINIWREAPPATKDVPCTVMFHFVRRPVDTLNLIVYMRSQDVWLGFPYDVHNFTSIQLILASILGCKPGKFTLVQGSLHMYEQDFEKAREAATWPGGSSGPIQKTPLSRIKSLDNFKDEINSVATIESLIRIREGKFADVTVSDSLLDQKLQWLQEFAKRKYETRNH